MTDKPTADAASDNGEGRIVALFREMEKRQASDLFITQGRKPYARIFGQIEEIDEHEVRQEDLMKFFASSLPPGLPERLATERDLDVGMSLSEADRFRLNLFFQKGRMAMVVRRVPLGQLSFEELGLPPVLQTLAEAPRGLILITGATGSGKSSTMAAILHHLNSNFRRHIVTIEDPIEFVHPDLESIITQREVGSDTRSFTSSLKHVVRQSPDAIFIGELRDFETIQTALSASMTGHLVVTTMHTVDVAQTLERIINYYPEHLRDQAASDLSMALQGIVAQRLLRRKEGDGLAPALEIAVGTPLIRQLIAKRQFDEVVDAVKAGSAEGMQTFTRSLVERYAEGVVTAEVGAAAATNPHEFRLAIQGMETGIDTLRDKGDGSENVSLNIRKLLHAAVKHGASDLLLTVGSAPILRINGELNELNLEPLTAQDTQAMLFSILNPSQRAQFESEKEIDFALSVGSAGGEVGDGLQQHRFRVNGFYQKGRVACALRLIPQEIPDPRQLGLPQVILDLAAQHQGLILVTGPTGHGKSTTLACLIDLINSRRSCHIITVEDPIEYVHENKQAVIEQREVYADTKSFSSALKYVLRQDPDVILVGEMRDLETISAALTAAETGHLVLATLHTNDAAQSIDRIVDSFPPHQQEQVRSQLANALAAIVAQRLLPRLDGRGRVAAFEVMLCNTAVRALIREGRTHHMLSTLETSAKDGMVTMDRALKKLYTKNLISQETMLAVAKDPKNL